MSYEGDYSPLLMPRFTAQTGIDVDVQSIPWTAAHEKLLIATAGGVLPDVMMLSNGWVGEFALIGAMRPIPPERRGLLQDQLPGMSSAIRIDGADYAGAWTVGTQGQFLRADLLAAAGYDAPPPTWAGWKAMLHALKRRNPDGYALLMLLNWPEHLLNFAVQAGARLLRDGNSRGNFASPEFRHALAFYKSLFDEGLAPPVLSAEIEDPLTAFARGWVAVYPAPPHVVMDVRRRPAEFPEPLWATAELPAPTGRPAPCTVGGTCLAVSRDARHPDRAWALIDYLLGREAQLHLTRLIGGLPSRPGAWNAPQIADDPKLTPFARQMRRPATEPNIPEWERVRVEVQLVAEAMVRGRFTVEEAAAEMNKRADRLLAKRRWVLDRGRAA